MINITFKTTVSLFVERYIYKFAHEGYHPLYVGNINCIDYGINLKVIVFLENKEAWFKMYEKLLAEIHTKKSAHLVALPPSLRNLPHDITVYGNFLHFFGDLSKYCSCILYEKGTIVTV